MVVGKQTVIYFINVSVLIYLTSLASLIISSCVPISWEQKIRPNIFLTTTGIDIDTIYVSSNYGKDECFDQNQSFVNSKDPIFIPSKKVTRKFMIIGMDPGYHYSISTGKCERISIIYSNGSIGNAPSDTIKIKCSKTPIVDSLDYHSAPIYRKIKCLEEKEVQNSR